MPKDTSTTREQIAALQQQIADLKGAAVQELVTKIKEAKAVVASLEKELADLTGTTAPVAEKQKPADDGTGK